MAKSGIKSGPKFSGGCRDFRPDFCHKNSISIIYCVTNTCYTQSKLQYVASDETLLESTLLDDKLYFISTKNVIQTFPS